MTKPKKKMMTALNIAAYIASEYHTRFGEEPDQMKIHKLLYFAQRENYVVNNEPLFEGVLYAGPYGPISIEVRDAYKNGSLKKQELPQEDFIENHKEVFDIIWDFYAKCSSWSLSMLSHSEISWKNAYEKWEEGKPYLAISNFDIQKDAFRVRRKREKVQ